MATNINLNIPLQTISTTVYTPSGVKGVFLIPATMNINSAFEQTTLKADFVSKPATINSDSELLATTLVADMIMQVATINSDSVFEQPSFQTSVYLYVVDPLQTDSELQPADSKIEQQFISTPQPFQSTSELHNPDHYIEGGVLLTIDTTPNSKSEFKGTDLLLGEGITIALNNAFQTDVKLQPTELVFNVLQNFSTNDNLYLLLKDHNGNFKVYKGKIRELDPQDRKIDLKAILGDTVLTERIIKEDYLEQDIGQTVKEIIETYCSPLTAENVNTSTGYTAPLKAKGKKPSQVLSDLQSKYPVIYFIDFAWDMHFMLEEQIKPTNEDVGGYLIRLGDE